MSQNVNWWELINSPAILTLFTVIWGSFVASWITALWQKRSHQQTLRTQFAKDILKAYQQYVRLLRSQKERLQSETFDIIHAEMASQARIAGVIFKDQSIRNRWEKVTDKLANIRGLRIDGKDGTAEKKLLDVFSEADQVIEAMYEAIA